MVSGTEVTAGGRASGIKRAGERSPAVIVRYNMRYSVKY